jgi:hypothetical protein
MDFSQYRLHLTRDDVDRIAHHAHWIPVNRGYSQAFVDTNYPGERFGELFGAILATGVLRSKVTGARLGAPRAIEDGLDYVDAQRDTAAGGPRVAPFLEMSRCVDGVAALHINGARSFAIEYDDGRVDRFGPEVMDDDVRCIS